MIPGSFQGTRTNGTVSVPPMTCSIATAAW